MIKKSGKTKIVGIPAKVFDGYDMTPSELSSSVIRSISDIVRDKVAGNTKKDRLVFALFSDPAVRHVNTVDRAVELAASVADHPCVSHKYDVVAGMVVTDELVGTGQTPDVHVVIDDTSDAVSNEQVSQFTDAIGQAHQHQVYGMTQREGL